MANLDYIEALKHAIMQGFSCEAKHVKTVPVKEVFQGKTAWEGLVEVFELTGNSRAKEAYGWGFEEAGKIHFATVLGISPVIDPQTAVKTYILSNSKS
jgi:hypothetical protein